MTLSTPGATSGAASADPAQAANPVRGVKATGNQSIDGLLEGSAWASPAISFSVPDSPAVYGAGVPEAAQDFQSVSAAQHAVVDNVLTGRTNVPGAPAARLGSVASFTNETFTDVGTGAATIMLASSSKPATAYSEYPDSKSEPGKIWFGQSTNYRDPALGSYSYRVILHELGHALGLKHGHEAGGVANQTLPAAENDAEYSVMTYATYIGSPAKGDTAAEGSRPQSYMMDDIAALQAMYGANFSASGPTRYSWDPNTGETFVNGVGQGRPGAAGDAAADRNKVFLTIWNGDGKDATYDFSAYRNAVQINLKPGQYSVASPAQLAALGPDAHARGNVYNARRYGNDPRSLIGGAVGGAGDDTITGNAADNTLKGGPGSNAIDGGGGTNTAVYDVARGQAAITLASAGRLGVSFAGGRDSLTNIQELRFSDKTVATASLPWLAYADKASGTSGTVAMGDPGAGSPSYVHAQYINAGAGDMTASTQIPNVFIRTGSGNDALQVASGQNILDGGLGSNFLTGGTGADTFFVDAREPGAVWDTLRNFHAGDTATLWGFNPGVSSLHWDSGIAGAAGSQGATLRADIDGRPGTGAGVSITFAGLNPQQAERFQVTTGTAPGGNYLSLHNSGVA